MQTQINFSIIEQAKQRIGIAKDTNNGAAVRNVPPIIGNDSVELEKGRNVDPENPYSTDVVKWGSFSTWNPLMEYERNQQHVFNLISVENWREICKYSRTTLLFDFDHWVSTNGKHNAEFANYRNFGETVTPEKVIVELNSLWKRYKASIKEPDRPPAESSAASNSGDSDEIVKNTLSVQAKTLAGLPPNCGIGKPSSLAEKLFAERLHSLYFYLWYSVLAINVDQINEFEHWIEMMECACCRIQIENVSICVKLLGGHYAEERENFLAKLRPHFGTHLQRVQGRVPTCSCADGMPTQ